MLAQQETQIASIEFVLDDDNDTTIIIADTDDQIDIKITGNDDFNLLVKTLTPS